jgi:hypothetical protein
MSISIVTNFKVNTYGPIDTRLVATNSAALQEIEFPYDGLTVFTKEQNLNYTYNGTVPNGQWRVSSNGVYGGSGSLVGNTDVSLGSIGNIQNDKSFEYILSASSSSDRAQMVTSFIRNQAGGDDYRTVEVRNQVRYVDNGSVLNGPYISFNKDDSKKGIISLGTPDRNFTTTVERFRVEPDAANINNGAVVIIPSTYSLPLYFTHKTGNETIMGYNWDGTSKPTTGTGSAIISFKSTGEIALSNISNINNIPVQQLVIGEVNNNVSSTVRFRVDDSGKDMGAGANISRTHNLRTIPEIVRNVEHNYTKLQSQGYKQLVSYIDNGSTITFKSIIKNNNILYITGDGNFFNFELPSDVETGGGEVAIDANYINDIKIVREYNGGLGTSTADVSEAPDGTEVTIRFTYDTSQRVEIKPTRIYLWKFTSQTLRKIKSSYADTNGGEYITILQGINSTSPEDSNEQIAGDIITFRKSGDGFWYVTNLNREKKIIQSLGGQLTWYNIDDDSGYLSSQSPLRRFRVPILGEETPTGYVWVNDTSQLLTATNSFISSTNGLDHPFKQKYSATQQFAYTNVNRAISLKVAKDLFGNVYLKGSFQITNIPFSALNKNYQNGIGNKFYIANISYGEMIPSSTGDNLYTTWGYCEVIVSSNNATGMPFNQGTGGAVSLPGRISVDSDGRVFLQFNMSFWTSPLAGTYRLDVNVPQFSYPTT